MDSFFKKVYFDQKVLNWDFAVAKSAETPSAATFSKPFGQRCEAWSDERTQMEESAELFALPGAAGLRQARFLRELPRSRKVNNMHEWSSFVKHVRADEFECAHELLSCRQGAAKPLVGSGFLTKGGWSSRSGSSIQTAWCQPTESAG